MRLRYTAYAPDGRKETGALDAATLSDAHRILVGRGLTPAHLDQDPEPIAWWNKEVSFVRKRLGPQDLAQISGTLALLVEAGLRLPDALRSAASAQSKPNAAKTLETIGARFADRGDLSQALEEAGSDLPEAFKTFLRLGDQANQIPLVLRQAEELYATQAATRAKITSALVYPSILIAASLGLFAVLTFFLAPALQPIFRASGTEPNSVLSLLFALNELLATHTTAFLTVTLAVGLSVLWCLLAPNLAAQREYLLLRAPVLGPLLSLARLAQSLRAVALLLQAGQPLQSALRLAKSLARAPVADMLARASSAAELAEPIPPSFQALFVPQPVLALLEVADHANAWPKSLLNAASLIEREVETRRDRLLALLTPAITLLAGGMMGVVMVSIVTALLDINDVVVPR
ncbi:MAG: type II secretion system F family protein [Pseudomonadota bacterium]